MRAIINNRYYRFDCFIFETSLVSQNSKSDKVTKWHFKTLSLARKVLASSQMSHVMGIVCRQMLMHFPTVTQILAYSQNSIARPEPPIDNNVEVMVKADRVHIKSTSCPHSPQPKMSLCHFVTFKKLGLLYEAIWQIPALSKSLNNIHNSLSNCLLATKTGFLKRILQRFLRME